MRPNYGITFCRRGIAILEGAEEKMFQEKGHGFEKYSPEATQLRRYHELLKRFTRERDNGERPSYRPDYHGSFDN